MKLKSLLIISIQTLLGHPMFLPPTWSSYAKRAYVEPIVIRDGYHDYVLMSADDYRALTEPTTKVEIEIKSPDLETIAPILAQMAKIGVPPAGAR